MMRIVIKKEYRYLCNKTKLTVKGDVPKTKTSKAASMALAFADNVIADGRTTKLSELFKELIRIFK